VFHKIDEVYPIFMGMTKLEQTIYKRKLEAENSFGIGE
jgi:hypothetical protein